MGGGGRVDVEEECYNSITFPVDQGEVGSGDDSVT